MIEDVFTSAHWRFGVCKRNLRFIFGPADARTAPEKSGSLTRPHSKSLLTADYADNADKYQFFCDQMVKHSALGGS